MARTMTMMVIMVAMMMTIVMITVYFKQVDNTDNKLRLTPLQTFAIETRDLLRHLDGCVSLNRFAPNFQQMYGRPCKAADFGFSRVSEVIDIIPNVAEIRGKGAEKMVVLVDGDDVAVSQNQGKILGLLVQLVERCIGVTEVVGRLRQALFSLLLK